MGLSTIALGHIGDALRRELLSHGATPREIARLDAPNDSGSAGERPRPSGDGALSTPFARPTAGPFHRA